MKREMPVRQEYPCATSLATGSFSYSSAVAIATGLIEILSPFCEILPNGIPAIAIVGSIRRRKPFVNDIDLVAIPKKENDDCRSGNPAQPNEMEHKLSALCLDELLTPELNGKKVKRFLVNEWSPRLKNRPIPLDMYVATRASWWTQLLLRTGSRDYNIELAARAHHLRLELRGDGSGLLSPGGDPIRVNSEIEIFNHLMLPYKPPSERS